MQAVTFKGQSHSAGCPEVSTDCECSHLGQEVSYVFALVPLDLNHLAKLFILDDGPVAAVFLLQRFENLLIVKALLDALQGVCRVRNFAPHPIRQNYRSYVQ